MRWTLRRKAAVLALVRGYEPALREAWLVAHGISHEEFEAWCRDWDAIGLDGLRAVTVRGVIRRRKPVKRGIE